MAKPYELTKDGIETQFQVNHLSHFLFIVKLAPLMEKTAEINGHPSRVVNLSSFAHNFVSFRVARYMIRRRLEKDESLTRS